MNASDVKETVGEALAAAKSAVAPSSSGGIPFVWAFFFAIVLLGGIYLGHLLTIKGQEQIRPEPAKAAIVSAAPVAVTHDPRVAESILETSKNVGGLSKSVIGLSESVVSMNKDFDSKMKAVEAELLSVSKSVENVNDLQKPLKDLHEALKNSGGKADPLLAQKMDALTKAIEGKKDADLSPLRQDLSTLNKNVMTLAQVFKDKMKSPEDIKLNSLGEEFQTPKK